MAIYKTGAVVAAISGKVGGQVFTQSSRGNVLRSVPTRTDPQTEAQLIARNALNYQVIQWRSLTTNQRNAWNAAARVRNYPNRLGVLRQLTGYNLYTKIGALYRTIDEDPPSIPPRMETTPYTAFDSFVYYGSPDFQIDMTWTLDAEFWSKKWQWQVRPNAASKPLSGDWKTLRPDLIGADIASISDQLTNTFGSFIAGQVYWCRFIVTNGNRLPSVPSLQSVTIT